jgi:integrase
MVWRKQDRSVWNLWVTAVAGGRIICSSGTSDRATAERMSRWCDDVASRGDVRGVLAAIVAREITLKLAYHVGEEGAAAWLISARAASALGAGANVWPTLEAWATRRGSTAKPVKTAADTFAMVRRVFPESPCPVTLWTTDEIERRLVELHGITKTGKARHLSDARRNRYRSALSVAAEVLRRHKLLATNPVGDVPTFAESPLTFKYLELPDARALIDTLAGQGRLAAALALGFGMEWSALIRCEVRDLNLTEWTAHVHGPKNHWRDRVVPLSDVFDWIKPIVRDAVAGKMPRTRLIDSPEYTLLRAQKAAAQIADVQAITLHQWRHSCAVILLQAGESASNVAHVLGHKDASLVHRRYGRFIVRAAHFVTRAALATPLATPTPAKAAGKHG